MARARPCSRTARLCRGWAGAAISTLCAATSHFAVTSHDAAAPTLPNPLLLGFAFALGGFTCVALAGRRLGALRTAAAVLASQVPFHVIFSGSHSTSHAAGAGAGSGGTASGGLGGHGAHAASSWPGAAHGPHGAHGAHAGHGSAVPGTAGLDPAADPGLGELAGFFTHGPMLWAHVGAAVVTYVALRHLEAGWWRLVDAAARALFTALELLRVVLLPVARNRPRATARTLPPPQWSPCRVISRRGPPVPAT